jgi:hypothetical protein
LLSGLQPEEPGAGGTSRRGYSQSCCIERYWGETKRAPDTGETKNPFRIATSGFRILDALPSKLKLRTAA